MHSLFSVTVAGLAAWRLSRMLVMEDGPMRAFAQLRVRTGIEYDEDGNVFSYPDANPLHCVRCTSVYAAMIMLIIPAWLRWALAVSGLVVLLESCVKDGR